MRDRIQRTVLLLSSLSLSLLAAPGAAIAGDADVLLTAIQGEASSANESLEARDPVADGSPLETGNGASLAVLVDRNAVVEMCDRSRVSFTRSGGNRVVQIDAGTVKLVVDPRAPGDRMEIHTPTAIATILGTVVYVTVDPVTGATTVASAENHVNVRGKGQGADPNGLTIGTNEQLTIAASGKRERDKRSIDLELIDALAACLADFHDLAVSSDRLSVAARSQDRTVLQDAIAGTVPPVSAPPPQGPETPGTDPTDTPFTPLIGVPDPQPSPDPDSGRTWGGPTSP